MNISPADNGTINPDNAPNVKETFMSRLRRGRPQRNRASTQAGFSAESSSKSLRLAPSRSTDVRPSHSEFTVDKLLFASKNDKGIGSLYFTKGRIRLLPTESEGPIVLLPPETERFFVSSDSKEEREKIDDFIQSYIQEKGPNEVSLANMVKSMTEELPSVNLPERGGKYAAGFIAEVVRVNETFDWQCSRGKAVSLRLNQAEINSLGKAAISKNGRTVWNALQKIPSLRNQYSNDGVNTAGFV